MKPSEVKQSIIDLLAVGLVPMLTGPPGIGKSAIIRNIAKAFKLFVLDIRLSQRDPVDLCGYPFNTGKRMAFVPPEDIPLQELDKVPDGYNGWLLFLDELPSATLATQAAAFKLILDRQVGQYNIHKKCYIVCAGNGEEDGGIVNRISTPMQSRLVHLTLDVDVEEFISYAIQNQFDHRVISYIESRPDHLYLFDPDHNDKTFASLRTWEFTSKFIKNKEPSLLMKEVLKGIISEGVATEFYSHLNYYHELPSIHDIIKEPDNIEIPDEPAFLFAISHMVAAYLKEDNATKLIKFIDRLPLDFGIVCVRSALKRNKELIKLDSIRTWAGKLADEIF